MFELFKNPNIDFMGRRHLWLAISGLLMLASLVAIPVFGIKRGIELGGGAEVQVKYANAPEVAQIRSALVAAGFESQLVTSIGEPEDHEVYIRVGTTGEGHAELSEEEVTTRVVDALRTEEMKRHDASSRIDVNAASATTLSALFERAGVTVEEAKRAADAVVEARKQKALFASVDEVASLEGVPPPAGEVLRQQAYAAPFAIRSQSYIGPAVGKELINKAIWAIIGSLAGMLIYIWVRFQFRWGLAAVVALVHDAVITLGLFCVLGFEMSLPVVASFLTLIGYSVNDKVVVFDRMRENLQAHGSMDLMKLLNDSMNQALSRTILTSTLTWIATVALFLLGGPALRDFSFPLMVGIIIGTYSSMYTAAPFLLLWQRFTGAKLEQAAPGSTATRTAKTAKTAKKVRAGKA